MEEEVRRPSAERVARVTAAARREWEAETAGSGPFRMHLAWRWFTGLGFDQSIPHHSTFSRITVAIALGHIDESPGPIQKALGESACDNSARAESLGHDVSAQAVNELVWNHPRCCCFGRERRTSGRSLRRQRKCRDRGPKRGPGRTNTPLPHIKVEQSQPQSIRQLNDPSDLPGQVRLPTKHEYSLKSSADRRTLPK